MKKFLLTALSMSLFLFASCGTSSAPNAKTDTPGSPAADDSLADSSADDSKPAESAASGESVPETSGESDAPDAALALLAKMSDREKLAQLFVVRPEALSDGRDPVTSIDDATREKLADLPVGGVALFGKNVTTPEATTNLISELQKASAYPLFISVDEEGGRVARLGNSDEFNVVRYDSMLSVGYTGDTTNARGAGLAISSYLRKYGFNLDLAPVADVNTNPDNPVIGDRSFGSDPELVAGMVCAFADGLGEAGVMSCLKHFPGHGDTKGDTHLGYVSVEKTWDELLECELIPFISGFAHADMVMIAHIATPNIDSSGAPASLSRVIITEKLRGELGYDGVIITDSLGMGAITTQYAPDKAALTAFLAGADILLMPENLSEALRGMEAALADGTLSHERLDESVLRILRLKEKYSLIG